MEKTKEETSADDSTLTQNSDKLHAGTNQLDTPTSAMEVENKADAVEVDNNAEKGGEEEEGEANGENQIFQCKECDITFPHLPALKFHMFSHTRDDSHGCKLCDKTFVTKFNLKRHMKTHGESTDKKKSKKPSREMEPRLMKEKRNRSKNHALNKREKRRGRGAED